MAQAPRRLAWRDRLAQAFAVRGRTRGTRSRLWRIAAPAVFLLAGALFITSAVSSGGTDLRAGRYDDLGDVAEAEAGDVSQLRDHQAELADQVDRLTAALAENTSGSVQKEVERAKEPAGLEAERGPGLTVTLDDAPDAVADTAETDISTLVVHQQDIQAVANALWSGGAEAMTIQGQRVVSTTGIRCVGNSVVLHDVPYAPPYQISAIGPSDAMLDSLDTSPYIDAYLTAVDRYDLGWDVEFQPEIQTPAYAGSTELKYAREAGRNNAITDDRT